MASLMYAELAPFKGAGTLSPQGEHPACPGRCNAALLIEQTPQNYTPCPLAFCFTPTYCSGTTSLPDGSPMSWSGAATPATPADGNGAQPMPMPIPLPSPNTGAPQQQGVATVPATAFAGAAAQTAPATDSYSSYSSANGCDSYAAGCCPYDPANNPAYDATGDGTLYSAFDRPFPSGFAFGRPIPSAFDRPFSSGFGTSLFREPPAADLRTAVAPWGNIGMPAVRTARPAWGQPDRVDSPHPMRADAGPFGHSAMHLCSLSPHMCVCPIAPNSFPCGAMCLRHHTWTPTLGRVMPVAIPVPVIR